MTVILLIISKVLNVLCKLLLFIQKNRLCGSAETLYVQIISVFPNYEGHFINNAHYFFLITRKFYFMQYLFTILLCSPPASQ